MDKDYRNTRYCPVLEKVEERKKGIEQKILEDHHKAKDMHRYISDNDGSYKTSFIEAYNGKCAYCGASAAIVSKQDFEIDHVIFEKSFSSKAEAGYIGNLVLACRNCNRNKRAFVIPEEYLEILHPDRGISTVFIRDDLYYIRISSDKADDKIVNDFYNQIDLSGELHRLDFLLMNMIGLYKKLVDKQREIIKLGAAIELLREKRNVMG